MLRESLAILSRRWFIASSAAIREIQRQQLAQQHGVYRFRCIGQMVFDSWPLIARFPGGLEALAHSMHMQLHV
jgi:hypothetical protein